MKTKKNKTLALGLTDADWSAWIEEIEFNIDLRARGLSDGRTVIRARLGTARDPHSTVYDVGDETSYASIVGALRKLADAIDAEEERRHGVTK